MVSKNTICLWYEGTALEVARFYAATFQDSTVGSILRARSSAAAARKANAAGARTSGACRGRSRRALTAAIADPDRAAARRAFDAMMRMRKIDIAAIEAARRG